LPTGASVEHEIEGRHLEHADRRHAEHARRPRPSPSRDPGAAVAASSAAAPGRAAGSPALACSPGGILRDDLLDRGRSSPRRRRRPVGVSAMRRCMLTGRSRRRRCRASR
jgi:hypothetical protein